jgi:P4 family phage/plasmid primase-like protien
MAQQLTLHSYLQTRQTTAHDWNITGMGGGWTGKYKIPEEDYDSFLYLIYDHIFMKRGACSLLERHREQGPILIDLDFRYIAGGPLQRNFTMEQIRAFVAEYATAFTHFFHPVNVPLEFFIMLKPAPEHDREKGNHKDGVHILCPSITTDPAVQFALRGWLLQRDVIQRIFGSTDIINAPQDCLDISVIQRNNWFLYGATKPDKAWYKLEQVYVFNVPEESKIVVPDELESIPIDTWDNMELIEKLSIRKNHTRETSLSLRSEDSRIGSEWATLVQTWKNGANHAVLPSTSLVQTSGDPVTAIPVGEDGDANEKASTRLVQVEGVTVRSGYTTEDIAIMYKLIRECLSPAKRATSYYDWVRLGLMLHNISPTEETYNVWVEFSRRVPGNEHTADSVYRKKWNILPAEASALQRGCKPLMMGTLHLWAREDNETQYKHIVTAANKELAYLNDAGTHVSVAELVVRMYRHEFRCTPPRKGATINSMDWYQYTGHAWRNPKTSMCLRSRLSNEVRNMYIEVDRMIGKQITETLDDSERQRLEAKRKNIFKVENSLHSTGFKDSVMKELTEKFYDEDFIQNMNMDPTLVGFSNGVLELRHMEKDGKPHVHFRPGNPDDCISFQMGRGIAGLEAIPYVPYDPENPTAEHLELLDFFSTIYPNPVLYDYVLTLLSSCYEGVNREQKFYIMTGGGSNGKSKIIELMSSTFGEYQETLSTTALTRKRPESGAANPDMVVLKCKRFISMAEPDEGEKINSSKMKQMSGEDTIKARALFSDQDQFIIMGKIFMLCNDMPPISSMDNGTWRRLRVLPHEATFVDSDMPIDPSKHIHYKDLLLDGKIKRWRPYFASLLVWYYEHKYLRFGLKEPPMVVAASKKYKEENDAFLAFSQECLIKEMGAEARANDVLIAYKNWTKYNPRMKILQKKEVLQKLGEMYGEPVDSSRKIYVGVRIAEEGEDISGNVIHG